MSLHIETKNTGEDTLIDFKNVEGSLFGLGDAVVTEKTHSLPSAMWMLKRVPTVSQLME